MDKTGFLRELERYLAILNEEEQRDILDEYAQHIDMKMERGMSEAEAIKDFGDMEELASQILEAYHVNPQYRAKKRMKLVNKEENPVAEITESGRHFWSRGVGFCRRMCAGAARGLAKGWRLLCRPFGLAGEAWKTGREKRKLKRQEDTPVEVKLPKKDNGAGRKKMFGEIPGMTVRGIHRLCYGIWNLAAWCVRWTWNLCLLFVALITGSFMLFALFGMGVLVVLLIQGYPLTGFTIGCLGLVLCAGSLTMAALCLCHMGTGEERAEGSAVRKRGAGGDDVQESAVESAVVQERVIEGYGAEKTDVQKLAVEEPAVQKTAEEEQAVQKIAVQEVPEHA